MLQPQVQPESRFVLAVTGTGTAALTIACDVHACSKYKPRWHTACLLDTCLDSIGALLALVAWSILLSPPWVSVPGNGLHPGCRSGACKEQAKLTVFTGSTACAQVSGVLHWDQLPNLVWAQNNSRWEVQTA